MRSLQLAWFSATLMVATPSAAETDRQPPDNPPSTHSGQMIQQGRELAPYSITHTARGFSFHRPTWIHPFSWSPDLPGGNYEVAYQISAKQRLFGTNTYFGYTQRSYWQLYNKAESSPFRETNYNPELFYRITPKNLGWGGWGMDLGYDHESNGRSQPESRSWNRLFMAAYRPVGKELFYAKAWWRLPEKAKRSADDPRGDDNPDIDDYYGYGELHYQRQFDAGKQLLHLMMRGNPSTGRGAVSINWSLPSKGNYAFWGVQIWHGYGESLIDYDRETTRIGIGVMLSR